ncbi:hypothetical protein G9A89_010347 [Geosiphon pyriformis]|nr:hypothetical protein G9A89_010347 [Geosiphon pyriformis]
MSECVHNTDVGFDLRYPEKDVIKLEPHSHICIDFKIALEIPATTMIQLASRSSLVKRRINIRRGIIDAEYIKNIIVILQNNLEKTYVIEPNEKIAQTIFLPLLRIMARRIQGFGSTGRIDVPVNMTEEEIIDKGEIISICQLISIPPYNQYMIVIEKKVKNQVQIFEAEVTLCESEGIGLVNLYILAKNYSYIKISIYNNTEDIIEIPTETTIRYLTTEIENQLSDTIPDFPQLCRYIDITSQTIYG